ncbi:hypothetical protein GEMRC1_000161 [Eukaryota sp. GEM-RC1]
MYFYLELSLSFLLHWIFQILKRFRNWLNCIQKKSFCTLNLKFVSSGFDNPIFPTEVANAIARLPKGKAAGPSGISVDLLKGACKAASEISIDLADYFQQLVCLKVIPPIELTAARLIALVKPGNGIKPDGIRPIVVGESISRLFASIVFNRVVDNAGRFLSPFQFGIKTIDGASVAALTSDLFFNSHDDNFIFNLDFKNAFNSVSRKSVFAAIEKDFPGLTSYFYLFYGKPSDLIYDSYSLKSMSGVKQGDPLGPLFFCLAIHDSLLCILKKYPDLKIVNYMDDISTIFPLDLLKKVAVEVADIYETLGLSLNPDKCLLIGRSTQELFINGVQIPFINYVEDAFSFLRCWLGKVPKIFQELFNCLEKIGSELNTISSYDIEKHVKFFILKIATPEKSHIF